MILETAVEVINLKDQELLGIERSIAIQMCIDLGEVLAVREYVENTEEEPNPDSCVLYMKGGDDFTVLTPYEEVLNKWKKTLKAM